MPVIIRYICGRSCAQNVSVRGRVEMKKAAIIIVLAIAVPLCLFAENWFTLSFNLDIESTCTSVFWNPTTCGAGQTPTTVEEVDVTNLTNAFATLGIVYTGASLVDIAVGFSPLYLYNSDNQTIDTTVTCPYTLSIFQPGTTTAYSETAGRGSASETTGTQTITYVKAFLVTNGATNAIGVANNTGRAIADFKITIDEENAAAGTYRGYMKCYITVSE